MIILVCFAIAREIQYGGPELVDDLDGLVMVPPGQVGVAVVVILVQRDGSVNGGYMTNAFLVVLQITTKIGTVILIDALLDIQFDPQEAVLVDRADGVPSTMMPSWRMSLW